MTRSECEKAIAFLLSDIRDTIRQYNPKLEIINLAITDTHSWAFAFDSDGDYALNLTTNHGMKEDC